MTDDDRQPFIQKALEDSTLFKVETKSRQVVENSINTGLQIAVANYSPSSPPSSPNTSLATRKRGPSAYQKWKKDSGTKTEIAERFPNTNFALKVHFKDVWNEMTTEAKSQWA